jgi:hypothetical protein
VICPLGEHAAPAFNESVLFDPAVARGGSTAVVVTVPGFAGTVTVSVPVAGVAAWALTVAGDEESEILARRLERWNT